MHQKNHNISSVAKQLSLQITNKIHFSVDISTLFTLRTTALALYKYTQISHETWVPFLSIFFPILKFCSFTIIYTFMLNRDDNFRIVAVHLLYPNCSTYMTDYIFNSSLKYIFIKKTANRNSSSKFQNISSNWYSLSKKKSSTDNCT